MDHTEQRKFLEGEILKLAEVCKEKEIPVGVLMRSFQTIAISIASDSGLPLRQFSAFVRDTWKEMEKAKGDS